MNKHRAHLDPLSDILKTGSVLSMTVSADGSQITLTASAAQELSVSVDGTEYRARTIVVELNEAWVALQWAGQTELAKDQKLVIVACEGVETEEENKLLTIKGAEARLLSSDEEVEEGWSLISIASLENEDNSASSTDIQTVATATPQATETVPVTATPVVIQKAESENAVPLVWFLGSVGLCLALLIALIASLLHRRKRPEPAFPQQTVDSCDARSELVSSVHIGRVHEIGGRDSQQDSFGVCSVHGGVFAVVADGMGGLQNGDMVSQKIVQTVVTDYKDVAAEKLRGNLLQVVARVNTEVNRMLGKTDSSRSGSTMLAVLAEPQEVHWASVGDSRIYLYRAGRLLQINREHNYEAELLLRAVNQEISFQDARTHLKRKSVTSFIGMGNLKYVDEMPNGFRTVRGDVVILCSDGVYNTLSDQAIEGVLASASSADEAAARLKEAVLARKNPHQDNFTAVLLRYE